MNRMLLAVLGGQLRLAQLPPELDLGPLWDGLAELSQASLRVDPRACCGRVPLLPEGEQVEYGACLLLDGEGACLHHQVRGQPKQVTPPEACRPAGHLPPGYAGYAHTHIPDPQFGGLVVGFSDLDYRATLADGDNLSLVSNGHEVFALARTANATAPRREVPDSTWQRWRERYWELEGRAKGGHAALKEALYQANRELCQELGFVLYRSGAWGQPLRQIFRPRERSR